MFLGVLKNNWIRNHALRAYSLFLMFQDLFKCFNQAENDVYLRLLSFLILESQFVSTRAQAFSLGKTVYCSILSLSFQIVGNKTQTLMSEVRHIVLSK